jgi:hypothetical protein
MDALADKVIIVTKGCSRSRREREFVFGLAISYTDNVSAPTESRAPQPDAWTRPLSKDALRAERSLFSVRSTCVRRGGVCELSRRRRYANSRGAFRLFWLHAPPSQVGLTGDVADCAYGSRGSVRHSRTGRSSLHQIRRYGVAGDGAARRSGARLKLPRSQPVPVTCVKNRGVASAPHGTP